MFKEGDEDFWIYKIPNFLSSKECEDLISYSKSEKVFNESVMYKGGINYISDARKSFTAWIGDEEIPTAEKITSRVEDLLKIDRDYFESLQIVNYPPGGYFRLHRDCDKEEEKHNRRYITVLIYLNDNFEGGETEFPEANIVITPKKGMAVIFWSLKPDGEILEESLHASRPITKGVKWVCNKWVKYVKK